MAKLTYWVRECLTDAQCYSVRAKTKKECQQKTVAKGYGSDTDDYYGPVHKVTVEFSDAFDLMFKSMCEGRIYEGTE